MDITEALTVAKDLLEITDNSKDANITRLLEASKAVCPESGSYYRPWIATAAYHLSYGTGTSLLDRYKNGLIEADGAKWVDPIKLRNTAIEGLLQTQRLMDTELGSGCVYPAIWCPDSFGKCCEEKESAGTENSFALGVMLI